MTTVRPSATVWMRATTRPTSSWPPLRRLVEEEHLGLVEKSAQEAEALDGAAR